MVNYNTPHVVGLLNRSTIAHCDEIVSTRERLLQEIESTRAAFHHLLDSLPEEALSLPSDNPVWNIWQVLYHIAIIPRYMIVEVVMIRQQIWLYQLLPRLIPKRLFDWLNARLTRLGARRRTRQNLAEVYDRSYKATLQALDTVEDEDFDKSIYYYLWDPLLAGDVTVEYLFGYIKRHFDSHAAQIETAVQKNGVYMRMSDQIFTSSPPRGFLAWLLRAPIWLYRFHLGGLFGSRALLLTHIGRKTGQIRQTVIEVVQYDEASGVYYVASGWGEKSNWYKNIMTNPSVTIQVKNKKYQAVAERVTPEMGGEIILNYVHRYPFTQRALSRVMKYPLDGSEESAINFGKNIPIIALRTTQP